LKFDLNRKNTYNLKTTGQILTQFHRVMYLYLASWVELASCLIY